MTSFLRTSTAPYTAVSYTWGDDAPTESIYINGQPFLIRRNLWSCLYYLSRDRNARWTHLWVDAICIDQTNDQERNAQVRAMDVIYRNALSVSVWLGLPPSAERYRGCHEPVRTFDDEDFDWLWSVRELANRPYWKRLWIIQEFLLGRDVDLYCGGTRVNWLDFDNLLGVQPKGVNHIEPKLNDYQYDYPSWAAWPLIMGRHSYRFPEPETTLCELLVTHCDSQCKDPRDRIFALLGLVPIDERHFLEQFFPNYAMSEDDVVIIVLSYIKQNMSRFDDRDYERLFLGLGVKCVERGRRLSARARIYDIHRDLLPSQCFRDSEDEIMEEAMKSNTGDLWDNGVTLESYRLGREMKIYWSCFIDDSDEGVL